MTDTRRKGFIVCLFAGILAMLAVTLYARLTEPSLVQHSHTQGRSGPGKHHAAERDWQAHA